MTKNENKTLILKGIHAILFSVLLLCGNVVFTIDNIDSAQDLVNKAKEAFYAGKYDEAITYADEAIRINPYYEDAYQYRGAALYYKGKLKESLADMDMAVKLNPRRAALYVSRGNVKDALGLYDEAIKDFNIALKLDPANAFAYRGRGRTCHHKNLYDQAIADFSRALEIKPDYKGVYFDRAMTYKAIGQIEKAIADLKKDLELSPDNKKTKDELAKLEKGFVAETSGAFTDMRDTDLASKSKTVRSMAEAGGKSTEYKRILPPFKGYSLYDPCQQSGDRRSGVPWKPEASASGGLTSLAEISQYEAMLRHTMQCLHLLYGDMSAEEEKSFNAFWAPFFDYPNKEALEYFRKLNPLLDELIITVQNLDAGLSNLGVSSEEMLLAGVDLASSAVAVAKVAYQSVKAERAKLDELVNHIKSLGNPPNPLAAKCAAQKSHREAIRRKTTGQKPQGESANILIDAVRRAGYVDIHYDITYKGERAYDQQEIISKKENAAKFQWDGNNFTIANYNKYFENPMLYCQYLRSKGIFGDHLKRLSVSRSELSGILSKDGMKIENIKFTVWQKSLNCEDNTIGAPEIYWQVEASAEFAPVTFGLRESNISIWYDGFTSNRHNLDLEFVVSPQDLTYNEYQSLRTFIAKRSGGAPTIAQKEKDSSSAKEELQKGTSTDTVDPEKDPKVIAEAIAEHKALAAQIRESATRWEEDAAVEKDSKRREELLKRALEMRANAQAEEDIAESLRTGTIVHTRTEWDEKQHQTLIANAKAEIAAVAEENKLLANIPRVADMLSGREGVDIRQQLQQRISEAIKSPERLQKLSTIYSELKNKVVQQGEQQIAAEQDKVRMWDERVQFAEKVQFAASAAVMLSTLWAPAEVGSLAVGYAGASGFVEDGVKGAAIAVSRALSARADVLIASYDAATKIDPATGEPAGIQGAIEGALWAIGTNKAFEGLSGALQNIKAASSRGVVKRQAESRLKEYDFKTPEERFKAELKAAKTPSEKAAVEKKYAIQVEREKMHAEMEEAKRKAVNALRQGGDRAKVKENYNNDLKEINEKYAAKETRNKEHEEVMKELGFNANDIKHTGSPPKNAFSDVDLTPQGRTPHEAYQKAKAYVEAMRKRDHSINEYGDRWVDNTSDTTIWKPGFSADTPGSSSFEAEVIFGTLPHSDKFGTKGGIEWTSSATHLTDDPLGAVLANAGKAAGAGLGNNRPKDLHTIGKSAVKAAESAGIKVEPKLKAQIEALKAHQTPEQADIYELGADKATQEKQTQVFLNKVQALMGQAFEVAKAKSEQNFKALEQQAKALGKSEEAYNLRAKIASYKAGNNAALTIITQASPGLGKVMAKEVSAVSGKDGLKQENVAAINFGGLARQLFTDRESAAKAPALPAKANDPAFANIGKRCKEAAQLVQQKLSVAKPGSDEAKYLAELKSALEQGEKNPAEAIYRVRAISGTELAVVLAQLGVK